MDKSTEAQVKIYYFWLFMYQSEYVERKLDEIKRHEGELFDQLIKKHYPERPTRANGVSDEKYSRVLDVVFKSQEYKKIRHKSIEAEEEVFENFHTMTALPVIGSADWDRGSDVLNALHTGMSFDEIIDDAFAGRKGNGAGIELIGLRHNSISQSGHFNGDIIASIDISRPLEVLTQEIERIQNLHFDSLPTFSQLFDRVEFGEKDFLLEKYLIRQCGGTLKSEYAPRAIGLWLSCYVHKNKCTQKSAIKALFDSFEDLSFLGKADVEDSDLRKYYRFTEACIDAAEVLPFTEKGTKKKKQVPGANYSPLVLFQRKILSLTFPHVQQWPFRAAQTKEGTHGPHYPAGRLRTPQASFADCPFRKSEMVERRKDWGIYPANQALALHSLAHRGDTPVD